MMREDLEHGGGRGSDDDFDGDDDDDDSDGGGGGGGARRKGSQRSAVGFSRRTVGRVLHPHVADGLGTAFAGYGGGLGLGGQRDTQALQSLWGIDDHRGNNGDGDAAAADDGGGDDGDGGGGADSFHRERLEAMRARTGLQFAANPRQFDRFTGLPKYGAELSDDDDVDDDDGAGVYDGAMEVEAAASAPQGRPGAGLHREYGNGPGVAERLPAPGASGLLKGPTGGAVKSALRPSAEAKKAPSGDVIGALRAQMRQEHAARARGQLYDDGYDDDDDGDDDEQDGAQRPPHSGRLMGSRVHFGKPGAGAALAAAGMCLEVVEHEPDSESGSDDVVMRRS